MRYPVLAVAAVVFFGSAFMAQAQIYKWKDADGSMHYSDTPPPGKAKSEVVNVKNTPVSSLPHVTTASSGTPTAQASASAASAVAEKKDAAACKTARDRLTFLQGSTRMQAINEKGNVEFLDADTKKTQIDLANKEISRNCE